MARLLPFSRMTKERLQAGPEEGGTHRWLPQVASGLRGTLNQEQADRFLRRCWDELVGHREVPDREVAAAVRFAYGRGGQRTDGGGRNSVKWPEANAEAIASLEGSAFARRAFGDPVVEHLLHFARTELETAMRTEPDNAVLLNFLGYGKLERGEDLDPAIALLLPGFYRG